MIAVSVLCFDFTDRTWRDSAVADKTQKRRVPNERCIAFKYVIYLLYASYAIENDLRTQESNLGATENESMMLPLHQSAIKPPLLTIPGSLHRKGSHHLAILIDCRLLYRNLGADDDSVTFALRTTVKAACCRNLNFPVPVKFF